LPHTSAEGRSGGGGGSGGATLALSRMHLCFKEMRLQQRQRDAGALEHVLRSLHARLHRSYFQLYRVGQEDEGGAGLKK